MEINSNKKYEIFLACNQKKKIYIYIYIYEAVGMQQDKNTQNLPYDYGLTWNPFEVLNVPLSCVYIYIYIYIFLKKNLTPIKFISELFI